MFLCRARRSVMLKYLAQGCMCIRPSHIGSTSKLMSHIVESCPLTKLNGGLSLLHSADEYAVSWLTSYG